MERAAVLLAAVSLAATRAQTTDQDEQQQFRPRVSPEAARVTQTLSAILEKYDHNMRPNQQYVQQRHVVVKVDLDILGIGQVSELLMQFSVHCYFRQLWVDDRLAFNATEFNSSLLPLNAQRILSEIWKPDTYIVNGKHSYLHNLTVPNRLFRMRNDGMVLLSQRLTITARCMMYLRKFPMDRQFCRLEFGSLGYSADDIVYKWRKRPKIKPGELSQFALEGVKVWDVVNQSVIRPYENSSTLICELELARQMGYYMLQIYIPCSIIVVLSWVSFWINKEAAIARVSLGVMTVLTLTTLRLGVRNELPPVDYATAIDVFLFVSFGFVLAALSEYIVIHFTHLREARKVKKRRAFGLRAALPFGAMAQSSRNDSTAELTVAGNGGGVSTLSAGVPVRGTENGGTFIRADSNASALSSNRMRAALVQQLTSSEDTMGIIMGGGDAAEALMSYGIINTKVAAVDVWAKVVFPLAYILFHLIYWLAYLLWIDDERPVDRGTFIMEDSD